ncbi:pyridoxal-phosphate-dependent aminotransferase family protein [Chryseomicrobium palamuruense]|uniref:Pyridoxal-phosphate-dependent aminotransferase family protein n=1 Tax=Chryseomicrobium palamuruense TaxID=682973 RepID=A0ABV8UWK1_9BACL
MNQPTILRIPGPTPVPPSVTRAMQQPMIGHRDSETAEILRNVQPMLQRVFGTTQQVQTIAGSGTSGLEAAVVNCLEPGEKAIVCVTGAFGERFVSICKAYAIDVIVLEERWGDPVNAERLRETLREHPTTAAVFLTYCETSTSVLNPIAELSEVVHDESDALVIVDGVSCIGAVPTEMDTRGLDVVVTGSQKALMLPGGLMFAAFSERARTKMKQTKTPRFYLDLQKYDLATNEFSTPFTPATSLLFGLQEVLHLFDEETLDHVYARHELMKQMTRAALRAMNAELLAADDFASPTVTAFSISGTPAKDIRKKLKNNFGVRFAGGQGHQKDTIIRIGHMGYCTPVDMLQAISALETVLLELNHSFTPGAGTVAAQQIFLNQGGAIHV